MPMHSNLGNRGAGYGISRLFSHSGDNSCQFLIGFVVAPIKHYDWSDTTSLQLLDELPYIPVEIELSGRGGPKRIFRLPGIFIVVAPKAMVQPRAPFVQGKSQIVSINDDLAVFELNLCFDCSKINSTEPKLHLVKEKIPVAKISSKAPHAHALCAMLFYDSDIL